MVNIDIKSIENQYKKYNNVKSYLVYGEEENVSSPFFSVVVPTCGRPTTIADTLASITNQIDAPSYEIVVVDNSPCNETLEIIKKVDDNRIRYYINENNIGLCGNWNRCTELSRGKYITMIHDDDILSPYFLNTLNKFIMNHSIYGVIGVEIQTFTDVLPIFTEKECRTYHKITEKDFFFGNYIGIAGMTYNKELALDLGGFQENDYPNEDTVFIGKAIIYADVYKLDCTLAGYRKAINLSMKDGIMEKIVLYDYATKISLAKTNASIYRLMNLFESEIFYKYFCGAENSWGISMDYGKLADETKIERKEPSILRMKFLQIVMLIQRASYKFRSKRTKMEGVL